LSAAPWWTDADAAELDVLFDAFLEEAYWKHLERGCDECGSGGPWCDGLRDVFEIVLDWRRRRRLQSKAEWLRCRERARREAA
jgi:hypothetical protein